MSRLFIELAIEGSGDYLQGYLDGFIAARGARAEVIYTDQAGFADEGALQKIKQALGLGADIHHVIVDAETVALVREALTLPAARLKIHSEREIESAYFDYSFAIFNPEIGQRLLAALQRLPEGVRLIGHRQNVEVDPDAKGAELYSPTHDFELKGGGRAEGAVDKIVHLYQELLGFEQAEIESIHVTHRNR